MRNRSVRLVMVALVAAGCAAPPSTPTAPLPTGSATELSVFLPTVADYAAASWDSWVVQQQRGPGQADIDHRPASRANRTEPDGCGDPPYSRTDNVVAEATGREINTGPTGFGGEASIRIAREPAATLLDDTRAWAKRCRDVRVFFDGAGEEPTAVSVLPPTDVDGIEVLRIHLTDNREHRDQPEGSRERVVSMALVRGVAVYGYGHDSGDLADHLMALTIRRLLADTPAVRPQPPGTRDTTLAGRSDVEIAGLLPPVTELAGDWVVAQALPVITYHDEQYPSDPAIVPPGCATAPFMNIGAPRADLNRDFRGLVTAAVAKPGNDHYLIDGFDNTYGADDTVRLNVENRGADVVAATRSWAERCATYGEIHSATPPAHPIQGTVDSLATESLPGVIDAVSVHLTQSGPRSFDFTASVLRIRGLLVVTLPAVGQQSSPLLENTLANLRGAEFTDAPAGSRPPRPDYSALPPPAGLVPLPAPNAEATATLNRVSTGTPVDTEPYHLGGYMPGDAKVHSPDTLYFHSPTGSINCAYRQHYGGLTCDVPDGSYPRTPAPADLSGTWFDHYVHFDGDAIENGMSAYLPRVAAESTVLPYGATIRLAAAGPDGDTECLMATDGLTCFNAHTRVGLHLSRDDLTPLVATAR